jgi:hypothetical protein
MRIKCFAILSPIRHHRIWLWSHYKTIMLLLSSTNYYHTKNYPFRGAIMMILRGTLNNILNGRRFPAACYMIPNAIAITSLHSGKSFDLPGTGPAKWSLFRGLLGLRRHSLGLTAIADVICFVDKILAISWIDIFLLVLFAMKRTWAAFQKLR